MIRYQNIAIAVLVITGLFSFCSCNASDIIEMCKYAEEESTVVTDTSNVPIQEQEIQSDNNSNPDDTQSNFVIDMSVEVDSDILSKLTNLVVYMSNAQVYSGKELECCQVLSSTLTAYKQKTSNNFTFQILKLADSVKVFISESNAASPIYQETFTYYPVEVPEDVAGLFENKSVNANILLPKVNELKNNLENLENN